MQKYKLLLLDLDGTILDFERSEHEAIVNCFINYGIEPSHKYINLYSQINDALWKDLEHGLINQNDLKIARFSNFLQAINKQNLDAVAMSEDFLYELSNGKYLIPGALDFIQELHKNHNIAYITNGISVVQRSRLKNNPISNYADKVYISEELHYSKPHPYMIQLAMKEFNIVNNTDVLVIGDSETSDIQAAINASVDSLYINFKNNYICKKATYTVHSYADALNFILANA